MGFQISLCQFHKNSLSERLPQGKAENMWDELTEHKAVSQKASFQFLTEDISFFTIALLGFHISLCKFHKSSLSERLLEGKALTLWDELPEHKAFSHKSSFQFLTEDISFLTIVFYGLPNITLQIPQEQSYRKASWGESCNSVKCINRTHGSVSESFFPVFNGRYFLLHHSPLTASKVHFSNFTRTVLTNGLLRGKL